VTPRRIHPRIRINGARLLDRVFEALAIAGFVALMVMGLMAGRCSGATQVADLPINQSPRQGATVERMNAIAEIYDSAARDINARLAKAIEDLAREPSSRGAAFRRSRESQLLAQLEARVRAANLQGIRVITPEVRSSVQLGLAQASSQMRAIGFDPRTPDTTLAASFTNIDARVTDVIARDTIARLGSATNSYALDAQSLFRTLSTDTVLGGAGERDTNLAIARGLLSGDPKIAERALRERFRAPGAPGSLDTYRKLGNRQITVGGWTGPLRTYTQTVVRTRTREATIQSRHQQLAEVGIDLVQIVGRRSENFCTDFLGLVCTLGPARDGYPALASLPSGGPPFHPNCSKGTVAFVEDLASAERRAGARRAAEAFARRASSGAA
jgi:hypothetical protein